MFAVCIFAGTLTACGSDEEPEGVKVTFELEGGNFKNSGRAVSYYYRLEEGEKALIQPPDVISSDSKTGNNEIIYQEHHIERWCRTRQGEEGSYSYSDPWDFEHDTISYGDEPLTLYAEWKLNIVYSFNICYREEDGTVRIVNSYEVNAGDTFKDTRGFADKRSGYTAERALNEETGAMEVCFYDENDQPWNSETVHPGGEVSTAVNVFVHYIKGEFYYVSTAAELQKAISDGKGVWLLDDIDLEGAEIAGFRSSGGEFLQAFYGNGKKVSNFVLKCASDTGSLRRDDDIAVGFIYGASLFGWMDGAIVRDVTFENMTILVDTNLTQIKAVRVAPVAVSAKSSVVENVTVTGSVRMVKTPSTAKDDTVVVYDEPFCVKDEATTVQNVEVSMTEEQAGA